MKNTLKVKLLPRVADYSFKKEFGKETGQKCKVSYLHSLKELKTLRQCCSGAKIQALQFGAVGQLD